MWRRYLHTYATILLPPLSYYHLHYATNLSWWKWCHISKKANLAKPSRWIMAGDVAVRMMAMDLVFYSHFCVLGDGAAGGMVVSIVWNCAV